MNKKIIYIYALLIMVAAGANASAQTQARPDVGGMFSAKISTDLTRRLSLGLEEELRLRDYFTSFNRLSTTIDADYTIIDRRLKIGGLYSYMITNNDAGLARHNHRLAAHVELRQDMGRFRLSLRGRYQSTFRQAVDKTYKVNPKNYIRTRLDLLYTPWGSAMDHSLSAEAFFLMDPYGNSLSKMRFQYTSQYRLDRRQRLEWSLRVDTPLADREDPLVVQLGIGYKFQL